MSVEIKAATDSEDFSTLPHPNDRLEYLLRILVDIAYKYVPVKKTSKKVTTKIPRERRILMRKRRKLTKQLEHCESPARKDKINKKLLSIELLLQRSHAEASEHREALAVKAIKTNPKFFFSYAKQFSVTKTKVGPLLNADNEYTSSSFEMANILTKQYSSAFSYPSNDSPYFNETDNEEIPALTDITFSETDLADAIDELSNCAASGPDGLSAIFLKKCKEAMVKPLYGLWRDCLDQGITPAKMKEAHIIPIYKSGHQGLASNYRPIALTSHLIKIFEKVLRSKIVEFLMENHLFNDSQHGFIIGRSCLSQLLAHHDEVLKVLESGMNVDTIYLDFAKAFDKVDHRIVLKKLSSLGIRGKMLAWLTSFLASRSQRVLVNGVLSEPSPVISGVPQGSVIGPLLFLILISDIDTNVVSSFLSSFADDTRVSKGVTGVSDASALQTDLEAVYEWAVDNNMSFNNLKFELLRRGPDTTLKACTNYTAPDGSIISEKEHVKDLGVTMSADCSFREHINKICNSARNMCSWILRTFKCRSEDLMLTTWKSLVLPILDYCSQLWCPSKRGDIQLLEDVQKSFTRKINKVNEDYWTRLSSLRLYSLERRRERYRLIYVWKILEGMAPNLPHNSIQTKTTLRNGRVCVIPLVKNNLPAKLRSMREGSFSVNGPSLFNKLPARIRNLKNISVDKFKETLDEFLHTIPDEPQCPGYTAYRRAESNSLLHMIPRDYP